MTRRMIEEERNMRWMVAVLFLLLLAPAIAGRLTGWRWQPWPIRQGGRRSAVGAALDEAVTVAHLSYAGL